MASHEWGREGGQRKKPTTHALRHSQRTPSSLSAGSNCICACPPSRVCPHSMHLGLSEPKNPTPVIHQGQRYDWPRSPRSRCLSQCRRSPSSVRQRTDRRMSLSIRGRHTIDLSGDGSRSLTFPNGESSSKQLAVHRIKLLVCTGKTPSVDNIRQVLVVIGYEFFKPNPLSLPLYLPFSPTVQLWLLLRWDFASTRLSKCARS